MRILVVEDEAVVARRLIRLAGRILGPGQADCEHAASFAEARQWIARQAFDLVLLDLDLSGEDGFRLLTEVTAGPFQTVVVSARHEEALSAFEHGVVDFVPKPFSEDRLRLALGRVRSREGASRSRLRYLGVRKGATVVPVRIGSILFIRGAGDYAELHCDDGAVHLHAKTLTALTALLPAPFLRVHRSYIVNLDRTVGFESEPGSRYVLRLEGGGEVPVSRGRVRKVRGAMPSRP